MCYLNESNPDLGLKIDRYGQAKILTPEEIQLLFSEGFTSLRDARRALALLHRALFGICLYGATRIREACSLRTADVYTRKGTPRSDLIIRKENTKGKLATRSIPVIEELRSLLIDYYPQPRTWFLFPGRHSKGHLHPDSAGRILKQACHQLDLEGISTHSFRRTALTQMSNAGIPLRVIQKISGHHSLDVLQEYLEITPEQVRGAASSLSMLGYSDHNASTQPHHLDLEESRKNEHREDKQQAEWEF